MVSGYAGTYRGSVVDDADPLAAKRLQVVVPEVYGETPVWAAALLPAGASPPLPSVGDLVWVSFEHGDSDHPVWQSDPGQETPGDRSGGYIGKYRGLVVSNADPLQQHRLEVTVPEIDTSPAWAVAGVDDHEPIELPDVGAEVWVEYEYGDPAYPRWVGLA